MPAPPASEFPPWPPLLRAVLGRWPFLLVAALLGGGLTYFFNQRKPFSYRAKVSISLGAIRPVGFMEDPVDLLRRLRSPTQVFELAGLTKVYQTPQTSTQSISGLTISHQDLKALSLDARLDRPRLLQLMVDSGSKQLALEIAQRVSKTILKEHQEYFDKVVNDRNQQIERYNQLIETIKSVPLGSAELEAQSPRWKSITELAKEASKLRDHQLGPMARSSRIVIGPDVTKKKRKYSPKVAAVMGFVATLLIAAALLMVRELYTGWYLIDRREA